MDTALPDQASSSESNANGAHVTPPKMISGTWNKTKWNTYLQIIWKEVETREAQIEFDLHSLEIIASKQSPEWVCL